MVLGKYIRLCASSNEELCGLVLAEKYVAENKLLRSHLARLEERGLILKSMDEVLRKDLTCPDCMKPWGTCRHSLFCNQCGQVKIVCRISGGHPDRDE